MNIYSRFLLGAAVLTALAGCTDDLHSPSSGAEGGAQGNKGPGVYIGVSFQAAGMGQTRSWTNGDNTSNSGTEVGTEIENNVNEVILVLARKSDNGFIGAGVIQNNKIYANNTANDGLYHATAKFYRNDLTDYYNDKNLAAADKGQINVFVIVNPTTGIATTLAEAQYGNTAWLNAEGEVTTIGGDGSGSTGVEGSIWSSTNGGNFLMTNVSIATREIPSSIDDWKAYTTEEKAFNLSGQNGDDPEILNNSTTSPKGSRGSVRVQRAAARMDFRDGSPLGNNTYEAVKIKNADGTEGETLIYVQLNKMSLVNMNNRFYYLKRVSDNGLPTGAGFQICGTEKPWFTDNSGNLVQNLAGNYVVDCDAETKAGGADNLPLTYDYGQLFLYPFFVNGGVDNGNMAQGSSSAWYTSSINEVLSGSADNWEGAPDNLKGKYRVWRYLTENTIPGPINNQVNAFSTGVVFKAKMKANESLKQDLSEFEEGSVEHFNAVALNTLIADVNNSSSANRSPETDPILYSVGGNLYASFPILEQSAIYASFSYTYGTDGEIIPDWNRSNSLYKAVFGTGGTGYQLKDKDGKVLYTDPEPVAANEPCALWHKWNDLQGTTGANPTDVEAALVAFKNTATGNNITIYQTSYDDTDGWGYYCYYYYWNRHNDNGNVGVMAPMEFAVVRNNVYKLAVTNIAKLGHPRIFINDPDKPTPNTPDESDKIYLTVECQVVPWTVRVNDITFE